MTSSWWRLILCRVIRVTPSLVHWQRTSEGLLIPYEKNYRSTNPRNCIVRHLNINSIRYTFEAIESLLHVYWVYLQNQNQSLMNYFVWRSLKWSSDFPLPRNERGRHGGAIFKITSSIGNIFRVTGPLCGEFTGHRWIPLTKASDAELWCFLWSAPE